MLQRKIGSLDASVVGLGTWALGGWMWGGTDETEAEATLRTALDCGVNLIDTAPAYGMGRSEEIVGKALRGRRDKALIATKCGLVWDQAKGDYFFDSDEDSIRSGGKLKVYRYLGKESLRRELENSLRRLQTDYVDLYQTHWQDSTTPIAETMEELLKMKKEGKIRAIGCSNATPAQMDEYRELGPLDSTQELYNMLDRQQEQTTLPYCAKHNVAFLSYSSLAQGLLTGKVGPERVFPEGDQRHNNPRFSQESRAKISQMLKRIQPVADKHHLTLGQLATLWTFSQPGCTHTLVGARSPAQMRENAAIGHVTLDAEDNAVIQEQLKNG